MPVGHLMLTVRATIYRRRPSTSSTSACLITVCCAGSPVCYVCHQSTSRRPAGRGDRLMTIRSRQTCGCLAVSALCDDQQWTGLDGDGLVELYDDIIAALLDRQAPLRTTSPAAVDRPIRASTMNVGQRNVHCGHLSALHVVLGHCLTPRRRPYRCGALNAGVTLIISLIQQKRLTFWARRIDVDRAQPRRLWR